MNGRVLVTNDDGIDAEGLRVLTAELVARGHEPLVVAPNRDYSGAGGSLLSLDGSGPSIDQHENELRYEARVLDEAPDVEAYALFGPPALCALLAIRQAFGPAPAAVVSGINFGLNVGPAVLHSGTVGAAITAHRASIPAIAVSSAFDDDEAPMRYDTAASLAIDVLEALDGPRLVNLNVPKLAREHVRGIRSGPLAASFAWRSVVESIDGGVIRRRFEKSGDEPSAETDAGLIESGYAAVTELVGPNGQQCDDLAVEFGGAST